jgi:predicted transcriptional regulator
MKPYTEQITARHMMPKRLWVVKPDETVRNSVRMLLKHRISGAPVVDSQSHLIGILSERNCIQALLRAVVDRLPPSLVRDVMTEPAITVGPDTGLLTIAHLFQSHPVRRIPVIEHGRIIGQIGRRDLLRTACKTFDAAPNRESAILYLSALDDRAHAPAKVFGTDAWQQLGPEHHTPLGD